VRGEKDQDEIERSQDADTCTHKLYAILSSSRRVFVDLQSLALGLSAKRLQEPHMNALTRQLALGLLFGLLGILAVNAQEKNSDPAKKTKPAKVVPPPTLPKGVVLEENPKDDKLAKIVFIAGSAFFKPGEHEYIGGCAALMDLVKQTKGTAGVLALDWPKDPQTLQNARAVVFFVDGAEKHPVLKGDRAKQLQKLTEAGVGLVMLHQGVDVAKANGEQMRSWMGASWEKGHSQRAHWITTYKDFPSHAITRGVKSFSIDDGYLYKLRFVPEMKGITPLLRSANPKGAKAKNEDETIISWSYDRADKGRSFAFTGGHLHVSLAEEGYRRFLVNAILWAANLEIPESGAPVEMSAEQLKGYLTTRSAVKDKSK
jgi:type 1 glutamine amidotransferase